MRCIAISRMTAWPAAPHARRLNWLEMNTDAWGLA
jgi:hypothetical protein